MYLLPKAAKNNVNILNWNASLGHVRSLPFKTKRTKREKRHGCNFPVSFVEMSAVPLPTLAADGIYLS